MHHELRACEELLQADNLILWVYSEALNALTVLLSTSLKLEENFTQTLEQGVTSQCFLVCLPILEKDLASHPSHDPSFDQLSGRPVQSLMAAPIYQEDEPYGVLTAARFRESRFEQEFSPNSLQQLQTIALNLKF